MNIKNCNPDERIWENIASMYSELNGRANRTAIFRHFRNIEEKESHKWPVCGSFNPAQRAINRLYRFERSDEYYLTGAELCSYLDSEISEIVNSCN